MSTFDKILDLIKSSAVTQGILSVLVVGGYIYMIVAGLPVPPAYEAIAALVVGFFFGGKAQSAIQSSRGGD